MFRDKILPMVIIPEQWCNRISFCTLCTFLRCLNFIRMNSFFNQKKCKTKNISNKKQKQNSCEALVLLHKIVLGWFRSANPNYLSPQFLVALTAASLKIFCQSKFIQCSVFKTNKNSVQEKKNWCLETYSAMIKTGDVKYWPVYK